MGTPKAKKDNEVLFLSLKKNWFDLILSNVKKEEYREITNYWHIRLMGHKHKYIIFRNGYGKHVPEIKIKLDGVRIGKGKRYWGAAKDRQYFVLQLGEIVQTKNLPAPVSDLADQKSTAYAV